MVDVGGPCKRCLHCMKARWFCTEFNMYVEPDGPNYACHAYESEASA